MVSRAPITPCSTSRAGSQSKPSPSVTAERVAATSVAGIASQKLAVARSKGHEQRVAIRIERHEDTRAHGGALEPARAPHAARHAQARGCGARRTLEGLHH